MAASIRIKLADLLKIMAETPPVRHRPTSPDILADLEAIREYLQNGPAGRHDLQMEFDMSKDVVLRRLHLLMERGAVVDLPGHIYGIPEGRR